MVSMASLDKRISAAIARVVADYNKKTKGEEGSRTYLTENDIVCNLYSELRKSLPHGYEVHAGLRPFDKRKRGKKVLRFISHRWSWKPSKKKIEGTIIDLCVLDNDSNYWKEAKDTGFWNKDELRYWRFVSYPVDAIRAAIEVKIRVRGKTSNIVKDFEKLKALVSPVGSGRLLGYVVVMDSRARDEDLERIKKIVSSRKAVKILTNKGPL